MCGIWGFVTNKDKYDVKYRLARELCLATATRGQHATGIAYTDGTHERYYKQGEPASKFTLRTEFEAILTDKPYMIMGHNRYATHGDPADNSNNHPFKSRTLQFMHNGVISNYESLKAEYKCYSECDSEVILRVLEKAPRRITGIQNVYREVRGSMACGLMDTRKLRMWLWRNHGNPIYLAYHAELNLLAFASTRDIFDTACKKAELTEGWSKGQYWSDDYIMAIKYRPDDDKILRELVEVESKHVDPNVVAGWTNQELTRYAQYYRDRDSASGTQGKSSKATRRAEVRQTCANYRARYEGRRQATWDSENKCWVI